MIEKFRDKFVYLFVIIVLGLFKLGQEISDYPIMWLSNILPKFTSESAELYFQQLIADLVVVIIMLIVLAITKKMGLLNKKGRGFIKGMPVALYPLCFSLFCLAFQSYSAISGKAPLNDVTTILIFILCMFMVGLSEELCTRTIIAETLLEHYGTSKKGIYLAAIVSGILFGLLHLFNLSSQDTLGTIVQVFAAGAGGITYAAIYFRTGNIWILVFVHMLNDIGTGAFYGLFNNGTLTNALESDSGGSALYGLVLVIPEIIATIYLLRDAKIHEVKESWPEIKD